MSLFEWLFEMGNRGPMGHVEEHEHPRKQRSMTSVIITGFIALLVAGLPLFFTLQNYSIAFKPIALCLGIELVYLFLAYRYKPVYESSNMGWLGGVIDNPFRISDDYNRMLLFLKLLLFPGRFVSIALVDFYRLMKNAGPGR